MQEKKSDLELTWNEKDEDTVVIEGIVKGKTSKKTQNKLSKVELHLFDNEFLEKMWAIEKTLDNAPTEKDKYKYLIMWYDFISPKIPK